MNKLIDEIIEYLNLTTNIHIGLKKNIVKQMSDLFISLTKEIVLLYHNTRNKQNVDIYNALPPSYKKVCYDIWSGLVQIFRKKPIRQKCLLKRFFPIKN